MLRQGPRGGVADRRDARSGERAGVPRSVRGAGESLEQRLDGVRARQAEQVVRLEVERREGQPLDPDRGRFDDLRAELAQAPGQLARLGPGARHGYGSSRQRARCAPGEPLSELRDRADHGDRGSPDRRAPGLLGDRRERARDRALVGQGAAFDDRAGLPRRAAGRDQRVRDRREPGDAHVEDERSREARQGDPIQLGVLGLGRGGLVFARAPRDERHALREAPVRDRYTGVGGRCHARRDPGDDLEREALLHQPQGLLAAPPEDERIPALQAHDRGPGSRPLD